MFNLKKYFSDKIFFRNLRKSTDTLRECRRSLHSLTINHIQESGLSSSPEKDFESATVVLNRVLGTADSTSSISSDLSEVELKNLAISLSSKPDFLRLSLDFHRIIVSIEEAYPSIKNENNHRKYASKIDPDFGIIPVKKIHQLKKGYERIRKERMDAIRQFYELKVSEEVDSIIPKLDITKDNTIFLVTVFGSMLTVSGYIYVSQLMRMLGLNSSIFFHATDYLSSSLTFLSQVLISIFIAIVLVSAGLYKGTIKAVRDKRYGINVRKGINDHLFIFLSIFGLLRALFLYVTDERAFLEWMPVTITIIGLTIISKLPLDRFFEKPLRAALTLMTIVFYCSSMCSKIVGTYHDIIDGKSDSSIQITAEVELPEDSILALSSSDFFIFYSPNDKVSTAIRRDEVKKIIIRDRDVNPNGIQPSSFKVAVEALLSEIAD